MRKILFFFIICWCPFQLYAQKNAIKGCVLDQQKQPIIYASVALLASDSLSLVAGTITDDLGNFELQNIPPDQYYISLSYIGYKPLKQKIDLTSDQEHFFILENENYMLDDVEITANRSDLVKHSAIGKSFMLSESATKKKNILEAMQEIPVLDIDPNTRKIMMIDGSKPLILINGMRREGGISSINVEDILSVDVAQTASAEFMREGYTSVVNIRTRKKKESYRMFNGGFYTHPLIHFGLADGSYEFGNTKYSLYFSAQSFAFLNNKSNITETTKTTNTLREAVYKRRANYSDSYFVLGGDLKWSDSDYSSFSVAFTYLPQNSHSKGDVQISDYILDEKANYKYIRDYNDKSKGGSLNIYHKHTFSGSAIDFLFSIHINDNKNKSFQTEENEKEEIFKNYNYHNKRTSGNFSPSYQFSIWGIQTKFGLNTFYAYNKIVNNTTRSSEFEHKEWNQYTYFDINHTWNKFSLSASIGIDAVFRNVENNRNEYINFRPVFNLGYRSNQYHSFSFNYNMQATSPDIIQLNPFNTSSDTLSIITGNPYLKPYQTQNFRLNYTFTGKGLYIEPFFTYKITNDAIVTTGHYNSNGQYVESLINKEDYYLWTVGSIFRYSINKVGFIGLNAAYNSIRFPEISQKDNYFTGRINLGLNFNKISISGSYPLPSNIYGKYKRYYSSPDSRLSISYAVNSCLDISIRMRYILWKHHTERWTDMPNYSYHFDNQFSNRGNIIMFGIRYRMQHKKTPSKQNKLQNIDRGFRVIQE